MSVSDRQRELLDDIWLHVKTTGIGIPERRLLDKYGKSVLLDEASQLGGTVIYSGHEENKIRYNVGIVGIFLTSDGPRLEELVERYLVGLRTVYALDNDIERFSSSDLLKWTPSFTNNELVELRHILYRAHNSLASGFGGSSNDEWYVSVDNAVTELKTIKDWKPYISSKVMQWYDAQRPPGEIERMKYEMNQAKPNPLLQALNQNDMEKVGQVLRPSDGLSKNATQPSSAGQRSGLHPWPAIRGFLLQLDSYEVPDVVDRAGLVVDWRLTEREDYSHKTRLAAYRPRIDKAYQTLPAEEDRLRVAYIVARDISARVAIEDLKKALDDVGWELRESRLLPAGETVRELFFGEKTEHDAYVEIRAILQRASKSITIVDPYVDQSILTMLSACIKPGMGVRLLASKLPQDFALEARKWLSQHKGVLLEVRTTREFHDRFIVLDGLRCWHVGASLKDAGSRAFMLSQIEDSANLTALVDQIEKSWGSAIPSVAP